MVEGVDGKRGGGRGWLGGGGGVEGRRGCEWEERGVDGTDGAVVEGGRGVEGSRGGGGGVERSGWGGRLGSNGALMSSLIVVILVSRKTF